MKFCYHGPGIYVNQCNLQFWRKGFSRIPKQDWSFNILKHSYFIALLFWILYCLIVRNTLLPYCPKYFIVLLSEILYCLIVRNTLLSYCPKYFIVLLSEILYRLIVGNTLLSYCPKYFIFLLSEILYCLNIRNTLLSYCPKYFIVLLSDILYCLSTYINWLKDLCIYAGVNGLCLISSIRLDRRKDIHPVPSFGQCAFRS